MDAVEVVARLGSSVVAIAHLRDGAAYRIGTAPGVDLAVPIATTFPLVERGVVRIPSGIRATVSEGGRTVPFSAFELWLGVGTRVELTIGLVTIRIMRVELPNAKIPRTPLDRRGPVYAAASLALHLFVWALAVTIAPFDPPLERMVADPIMAIRVAKFDAPPQPPDSPSMVPEATTATTDPVAAPAPADTAPHVPSSRRGRAIARAREAGFLTADGLSDLSALATKADFGKAFEGVGPAYREDDANRKGFGGGGDGPKFNPGTIATGEYATVSDGSGAGEDYDLPGAVPDQRHRPVVEMCTGRPCETEGPLSTATVRTVIAVTSPTLIRCYKAYAEERSRGTVTLDFEIDRDGTVLRASSRGFGQVAACVQAVVEKIDFPIAPGQPQTTVQFSLGFR